jgi:hypothetical protein
MLDKGDLDGCQMWKRIPRAVEELRRERLRARGRRRLRMSDLWRIPVMRAGGLTRQEIARWRRCDAFETEETSVTFAHARSVRTLSLCGRWTRRVVLRLSLPHPYGGGAAL